ncbi:hypothetical protein [Butyricicoccus sp.]|uniref:hypothetical protein n=1 Tax=Butyricicoccus sp. TaxID=2049021 RepID=UPI003F14B0ED
MKRGYHSTQRKYFNTVPRSEFLGLALGYAVGMFLTGLFRMEGSTLEIVGTVVGFGIGYWIDGKYFAEKDVPAEQIESEMAETEKEDESEDIEEAEETDEAEETVEEADDDAEQL